MSLRVIKQGLLDTIQDGGRKGHRHLGINCNGAIDRNAAMLANALLGKDLHAAVLECHFPAGQFLFTEAAVIVITGADFQPCLDGIPIPLCHPVAVRRNTVLSFQSLKSGARCYVAMAGEWQLHQWLGSYSTNLAAHAGGWHGRALRREDEISIQLKRAADHLTTSSFHLLPWKGMEHDYHSKEIHCIVGNEWHWLTPVAQEQFSTAWFDILHASNRMGYRLHGTALALRNQLSMLSSAVDFGTIQLLPDGQLIVLMADHQTTGGYPRIAHVISDDLPLLAQKNPGASLRFRITDLTTAEQLYRSRMHQLDEIRLSAAYRMEEFFR